MDSLKQDMVNYLSQFVTEKRLGLFRNVLENRTRFLTVVLEDAASPHDACAVMRSCECFGVQDFHVISQRTAFRLSKGVAVGASKWVSTRSYRQPGADNTTSCLQELKGRGYQVVAISPKGRPIQELPLDRKTAVVFGSEEMGLSDEAYAHADFTAGLPADGFTRTFNISVCAALCLSTLRTRLQASDIPWALTEEEKADLMLEWLAKMPRKIKSLTARFLVERGLKVEALTEAGFSSEALALML